MGQSGLFWVILMIVVGAGMYIYADGEQTELKSTPGGWMMRGYAETIADMQTVKNLGLAMAGIGVVLGIVGAMNRDPPNP